MRQDYDIAEMVSVNDMKNVMMEMITELLIPIVRLDVISKDDYQLQ